MRKIILVMTCCFFLGFSLEAQERDGEKIRDEIIAQGVSRFLRWTAYWQGNRLQGYVEGKTVEMAIVESPKEVALYLTEFGSWLWIDSNGRVGYLIVFPTPHAPTAEAIEKYVTAYPSTRGESLLASYGKRERPTLSMEEKSKILAIRRIPYTLPTLSAPDSIVLRVKSPEILNLKDSIPDALEIWHNPSCGKGELVIPYFVDDDPLVYVYADLGNCGTGLFVFSHARPGVPWYGSRIPDDVELVEDLPTIIQKVRENAAETVPLPLVN